MNIIKTKLSYRQFLDMMCPCPAGPDESMTVYRDGNLLGHPVYDSYRNVVENKPQDGDMIEWNMKDGTKLVWVKNSIWDEQ